MSSAKKTDFWRDFAAGVYLSEAQNPISPPPLLTVYVYMGMGGGGRDEPEGRLKGQKFTKLGRKYQHNWQYLQPINSDKHLRQCPFKDPFFLDDDISLWRLYS